MKYLIIQFAFNTAEIDKSLSYMWMNVGKYKERKFRKIFGTSFKPVSINDQFMLP